MISLIANGRLSHLINGALGNEKSSSENNIKAKRFHLFSHNALHVLSPALNLLSFIIHLNQVQTRTLEW